MKYILVLCLLLSAASTALAGPSMSKKSSDSQKVEADVSQMWRKSTEQRESDGKRTSSTSSSGRDHQRQQSDRTSGGSQIGGSLDATLSLDAVFGPGLAELETTGPTPWSTCRLLTAPRLAADLGLSTELPGGFVDTGKGRVLQAAASSNLSIRSVDADERAVLDLARCLAVYGETLKSAALTLSGSLGELANISRTKSGEVEVRGLGLEDLARLAKGLTLVAGEKPSGVKYERQISGPCRFAGSPDAIQCGAATVKIGPRPELIVAGVQVYGPGSYGGIQATYKISSSWSYSRQLEAMQSTSEFSRFASEVSKYAEALESRGRSKEAAMARKKAVDLASHGEKGMTAAPTGGH